MNKEMYSEIEKYMHSCMNDGAHDSQHIYRVLYFALDLASEFVVDMDVLIASSLLHDIGRDSQFKNPECDHAIVGANMAYNYLLKIGWEKGKATHVRSCIETHRFRNNHPPESIEAKILFDADKLDVSGAIGIARTLAYTGIVSNPLYSVDEDGIVLNGELDDKPSFFKEYNWKLKYIYDTFFTNKARKIAQWRQKASIDFYESMHNEVFAIHKKGISLLKEALEKDNS